MLHGADVSKYQGKIDWDAFAPQLDFVFMRATFGTATDTQFARNRAEAARSGLVRGYYHFGEPSEDATQQARFFCDAVGTLAPGEMDLVLDLETTQRGTSPSGWTSAETAALQAWTRTFCRVVKDRFPGRSLIVYTGAAFWQAFMGGTQEHLDCPLWLAAYRRGTDSVNARPPADPSGWEAWAMQKPLKTWAPWPAWSFWQFTPKAVMKGVTVNTVDANLFAGTKADLRRLARLEVAEPAVGSGPTADALCRIMLTQAGDPYIFGHEVRLTDPNPRAFDCSEMVEWACAQLAVKPTMPDGSWFQVRHVKQANLLMPVGAAISTRGALLFRFSSDPFNAGRPTSSHVAVSLGDGRTIEARSTQHGVGIFPALDRGWTHAGRVPGLDYAGIPQGGSIQRGSKGVEVAAWQRDLLRFRPNILPRFGADADFGGETDSATRTFQAEMGLAVTGIVGPETRDAMQRALARGPRIVVPGGGPRSVGPQTPSADGGRTIDFRVGGLHIEITITPETGSHGGTRGKPDAGSKPDAAKPEFDGLGLDALPKRADGARTGSQLAARARKLGLAAREEMFVNEVLSGNVPSFVRRFHHVAVSAPGVAPRGALLVCADYLAVGSDTDFLRVPLTAVSAQRIADACRCLLPTKKLVDDIYRASTRQAAIVMEADQRKIATFVAHDRAIEEARKGELGELLAGHKKDVVVTKRLGHDPRRLALYGFFGADEKPLQRLDTLLTKRLPKRDTYVDYSQGIRLVGAMMFVGGERVRVSEVLADPHLSALVSSEGIISSPRYEIHPLG